MAAFGQIQSNSAKQPNNMRVWCTQHIALRVIWTAPLDGSHCGITGGKSLKLMPICLLPLASLPVVPDTWGWGDPRMREPRQSCPLPPTSAVLSTPVQGSSSHTRACCPPCQPPEVNSSFLHSHFHLVKWPRGETGKRPMC